MSETEQTRTDLIPSQTDLTSLSQSQLWDIAIYEKNFPRAQRAADLFRDVFHSDQKIEKKLCDALAHEDSSVRRRASDLIGSVPFDSPEVVEKLCELLRTDRSWPAREAAINTIGHWLNSSAVSVTPEFLSALLESVLREREVYVSDSAIRVLSSIWSTAGLREELQSALQADSVSVRRRAIKAWTLLEPAYASLPVLKLAMCDSHHKVRKTAIVLSPRLGKEAIPLLATLCRRLGDGENSVSRTASETLTTLLTNLPATHQFWVSVFNNPALTSLDRLQLVISLEELSDTIAQEFTSVCVQRAAWAREQLGYPRAPLHLLRETTGTHSAFDSIRQAKPIGQSRNDARLEKESAWLLGKLYYLIFDSLDATESDRHE